MRVTACRSGMLCYSRVIIDRKDDVFCLLSHGSSPTYQAWYAF